MQRQSRRKRRLEIRIPGKDLGIKRGQRNIVVGEGKSGVRDEELVGRTIKQPVQFPRKMRCGGFHEAACGRSQGEIKREFICHATAACTAAPRRIFYCLPQLRLVQAVGARPSPINFRFDFGQVADPRAGPNLLVLFLHEGEFPQMPPSACVTCVRAGHPWCACSPNGENRGLQHDLNKDNFFEYGGTWSNLW